MHIIILHSSTSQALNITNDLVSCSVYAPESRVQPPPISRDDADHELRNGASACFFVQNSYVGLNFASQICIDAIISDAVNEQELRSPQTRQSHLTQT